MKILISILTAALGLITTACNSQAGLGWTLDECVRHYGQPTSGPASDEFGRTYYDFESKGYTIFAFYTNAIVSRIAYKDDYGLDELVVKSFLSSNAPDADWESYEDTNGNMTAHGRINGKEAYTAVLDGDKKTLVIFTIEDAAATDAAKLQNTKDL
jgi:hypothetical protein